MYASGGKINQTQNPESEVLQPTFSLGQNVFCNFVNLGKNRNDKDSFLNESIFKSRKKEITLQL